MEEKVIIVGSGPAGLTAAIYAARFGFSPLVVEGFQAGGMSGGQLMTTGIVENFPGFPKGIDGQELMANMRAQAENAGAHFEMDDIKSVDLTVKPFRINLASGQSHTSRALIVATGATARRLPLDSEKKFWGKGISACAVCDGALPVFRQKPLAVIGGGDSAIEEAHHLTQFASKVYIIHRRDKFRASPVMIKRAMEDPKIEVLWNKTIEEFNGESMLNGITLVDTVTGEKSELQVNGAFEAIGHTPNTSFLGSQVKTDDAGYIITEPGKHMTSVKGVFAAGDVRDPVYRQAIAAAGSGCMAALEAERWLSEM